MSLFQNLDEYYGNPVKDIFWNRTIEYLSNTFKTNYINKKASVEYNSLMIVN